MSKSNPETYKTDHIPGSRGITPGMQGWIDIVKKIN